MAKNLGGRDPERLAREFLGRLARLQAELASDGGTRGSTSPSSSAPDTSPTTRARELAGIPGAAARHQFSSFAADDYNRVAFAAARKLLDNLPDRLAAGVGLYVYGAEHGTGKTFLAHCLANELVDRGVWVRFYRDGEVLRLLRSAFSERSNVSEAEVMDRLVAPTVLVVDDFGKHRVTEWTAAAYFDVVDQRMEAGQLTIFTSNLGPADVEKQFGERGSGLASRITAMCDLVELFGPDRRLAAAQERRRRISGDRP